MPLCFIVTQSPGQSNLTSPTFPDILFPVQYLFRLGSTAVDTAVLSNSTTSGSPRKTVWPLLALDTVIVRGDRVRARRCSRTTPSLRLGTELEEGAPENRWPRPWS